MLRNKRQASGQTNKQTQWTVIDMKEALCHVCEHGPCVPCQWTFLAKHTLAPLWQNHYFSFLFGFFNAKKEDLFLRRKRYVRNNVNGGCVSLVLDSSFTANQSHAILPVEKTKTRSHARIQWTASDKKSPGKSFRIFPKIRHVGLLIFLCGREL